jgi:hypothetical protein
MGIRKTGFWSRMHPIIPELHTIFIFVIFFILFFKLNNWNNEFFEIKNSKSKLGFSKWTKINVQI